MRKGEGRKVRKQRKEDTAEVVFKEEMQKGLITFLHRAKVE